MVSARARKKPCSSKLATYSSSDHARSRWRRPFVGAHIYIYIYIFAEQCGKVLYMHWRKVFL